MDENPEREQVENDPNKESFRCTFEGCDKTFPSLTILCTHEAVCGKAGAAPRVSCEICGSRTYAYSLKKHMKLHKPAEHQCPVCRKMFHFRYNLNAHIKIHAKELDPLGEGSAEGTQFLLDMVAAPPRIPKRKQEPENFPCTVCPSVFKSSRSLRYHLNVHEGLTPFTCRNDGCDEAFASHQVRHYHERVCRGESRRKACTECGVEIHWKHVARHMRKEHLVAVQRDWKSVIKDKLYPCGQCSAVLSSKRYLICHMNQHKGIKPYPCRNEGCRESFAWDSHRRKHEKVCREAASTCPVCGVALANGSVRQDHMAAFHKNDAVLDEMLKLETSDGPQSKDPNELPDGRMKCPECGKKFRKKVCFAYHMNMHKGVRPYECAKCERGFYSKQAHAYHEKKCLAGLKLRRAPVARPIQPPRPAVKRSEARVEKKVLLKVRKAPTPRKRKSKAKAVAKQCELCNTLLRSELMYEKHMAVHNGAGIYCCRHNTDCAETFHTLRERQLHEAERHGGQMPEEPKPKERKTYMCEICSVVCLKEKSFRNHMNAHSGIKQLVCRNEGCEVTFYSHSARLAHEEPCRGELSTCPVCDVKLKTKNILRIHMRRKHPDQLLPSKANAPAAEKKKIFTCTLCSREFRSPKSLNEHMNDHTGAKPFQCRNEGCTERFARLVVRKYHEEGCRGFVAPCPFCDVVLKNSFTLKNHVASLHVAEKESFDKGIYSYQDQLRLRSELEKNVEQVEYAEEEAESSDETLAEIKCEVEDDMQVEWLEDIIEEVDLDSEQLEIKDEGIVDVQQADDHNDWGISPRMDNATKGNLTKTVEIDGASRLDNPGDTQIELEDVEIKSEVDTEDEADLQSHVEGVFVEPLKELNAKSTKTPSGSKPIKCRNGNGCQRTFGNNQQARAQHERHCRGESFRCPRKGCSYGPTNKFNIQQHLRHNHGEEEEDDQEEKQYEVTTKVKEELQVDVDNLEDSSTGKGKFKCDKCSAVFIFADSLKYHMNRHNGVKPYPCENPGCGQSFASPGQRRRHHCLGEATQLTCSVCSIEFRNQQRLYYHMRTEHGVEFPKKDQHHVCDKCGTSFENAKSLRIHMFKHDGKDPFECRKEGCDKRFRNTSTRNYHEKRCGESGVECPFCLSQLVNKEILETHIKRMHDNAGTFGSYLCEICSKIFNRQCDLTNHKRAHDAKEREAGTIDNGDGMVKCGVCSKYLRKKTYKYHLNSHQGVRPYACSNCQQGFFSKQAHHYHQKKCLAGKKMRKSPRVYIPFVNMEPKEPESHQCSVCSQIFPNRYTLYHHKQSHLGPLVCTEGCNKSFSRVDLLRKHMREVHGIGEKRELKVEKTLKCHYCPMMFGFKASLVRHMKLHEDSTRARCPHEGCNQTFTTEKMLTKHLAVCYTSLSMSGEQ